MGPYFSGVDLIEIERFQRVLDRHGDRFLRRCFTDREVDYCRGRVHELAVRFAGKEATMKALGTGVRGISWREIEILANARGKPVVVLHGRALARAAAISQLVSSPPPSPPSAPIRIVVGRGSFEIVLMPPPDALAGNRSRHAGTDP